MTDEEWERRLAEEKKARRDAVDLLCRLAEDAVSDSEVINMAWVMGLKTVLVYARSIELSGGMDC